MQNETIGLYPKPPKSPLYALAPLVRAQGIIKFEDAEYDSHLSSKQLLTGSIWISEKNFFKLCNNAAKSIKNPGGYNIVGLGSANCIRHVISAFEAIGETNIIARAFNVIDFHEMKNNLIKLQLGFYFKESQELCLYSYIAGMQGNSDYTVMSKDFSDYWEHSRKVGQNFKDAELARQGNTSVTSHKP